MNEHAVGKYLIVTADDFGLTPGINRAILQAHAEGIVTSASLMAVGAAFEDAVSQARSFPHLGLGPTQADLLDSNDPQSEGGSLAPPVELLRRGRGASPHSPQKSPFARSDNGGGIGLVTSSSL